jgi:hypothetical protein
VSASDGELVLPIEVARTLDQRTGELASIYLTRGADAPRPDAPRLFTRAGAERWARRHWSPPASGWCLYVVEVADARGQPAWRVVAGGGEILSHARAARRAATAGVAAARAR